MAILKVVLFVLVSSLGYSNCALVDTLHQCALKDYECQIELFDKIMQFLSEHGAKEYNIPRVDPIEITNLNGSIEGVLNLIFKKGTVKGIKYCEVKKWNVDVEKSRVSIALFCPSISIKGKYHVESTTDVLKSLIGGDVHGDGTGKLKLEDLSIDMGFPYSIEKRGEDFFFISDLKKYKYSFKVNKRATFAADKLYVGKKESSKEIIKLINENWAVVLEAFGKHFMDVTMEYMYPLTSGFFRKVPTKAYILDDLTPYYKGQ